MKYKEFTYNKQYNRITLTSYDGHDTNIKIPSFIEGIPVTSLEPYCFIRNESNKLQYPIQEFIVDDDNQAFTTFEGALYSKDMTTLYRYPNIQQTTVKLPDTLTKIQTFAFAYCTHIKEIYISQNVNKIEIWAFVQSSQLENIIVDPQNPYFTSINGILYDKEVKRLIVCPPGSKETRITIPQTVQNIVGCAFHYCNNVRNVQLPDNIKYIDDNTFRGCRHLYHIQMPANLQLIGNHAFADCGLKNLELPESLCEIGNYAFENCTKLRSITIPKNVTHFGENIFKNHSLLLVNVHEHSPALDYIIKNNYQFKIIEDTNKLEFLFKIENKSITLMQYIGQSKDVDIPATLQGYPVTNIDHECFDKCEVLSFNVDQDNTSLTSVDGVIFSKDKKYLIAYPKNKKDSTYQIPNSVHTIHSYAFYQCLYLKSIDIPDSVTTIEDKAFNCCRYLETINVDNDNLHYATKDGVLYTKNFDKLIAYPPVKESSYFKIPDGVTYIEEGAFNYCCKTDYIYIPSSVTTIGLDAFSLCYNLQGFEVDAHSQYFKSSHGTLHDITDNLLAIPSITSHASVQFKPIN